ncbi:hypothetical protein ACFS5J_05850 [Flavobacterium chuncheonense]|uniref:Uncharacterized protein n=1 Tax=Flavobacterium chuncheonense TaxID=2026653 RepID=A0ABW5YM40_9FLAO
MKKALLITILLFSIFSFSQVDRRNSNRQYENPSRNNNKKVDFTEQTLNFFKEKIKVDSFQEAVIRNLLNDYEDNAKKISISEAADFEKKDQFLLLGENFKSELKKVLSEEQFLKYEDFMNKKKKK